jgi:hypothetical protein
MTSICWKSAVTWSLLGLLFLLFALVWGPVPALAGPKDAVLYEVTEDMYLVARDAEGRGERYVSHVQEATHRQAVAQLSGWAKIGTPLCPLWVQSIVPNATECVVNAKGSDNLSLTTGKGTLGGSYAVVVQDNNVVDGPEFVIMTGTFTGDADLSLSLSGQAPLGVIANGVATVDGYDGAAFTFTGTFRLPFAIDEAGKHRKPQRNRDAFYLNDDGQLVPVKDRERSLGIPTVRLEIGF